MGFLWAANVSVVSGLWLEIINILSANSNATYHRQLQYILINVGKRIAYFSIFLTQKGYIKGNSMVFIFRAYRNIGHTSYNEGNNINVIDKNTMLFG